MVGGTGFIGYHLLKICKEKGWICTSISTKKPNSKRFLKKVNYIICDISKSQILRKKIKDNYDYVVNLGGHVDHTNKLKVLNSHYIGCKNLVKILINTNIKSFVQIGSGMEYGTIKSPQKESLIQKPKKIKSYYGKAKLLATNYLKEVYKKKKFPFTVLRLYQVFGPKQDLNRFLPIVINSCLQNKKFPCTEGSQQRDFIYINDVTSAIIKSLRNKSARGEIFNIGFGKPLTIRKITQIVNKQIGKGVPLYGKIKMRKDEVKKLYPNILKAKKKISWQPKVSFQKGLSRTIKSYLYDRK